MFNYPSHRVKGESGVSRTYRTVAAAAVLAVLGPAAAAQAAPEDDAAELSQTIEIAWLMPGDFQGWATFPQTYLPGGVPACGEGAVQVDVYKYGTQEMRDRVHALIATGVLTSPADDSRFHTGRYRFVDLEPCSGLEPGDPLDPADPGDPGGPGDATDPVVPGASRDQGPATAPPPALPARALKADPTYAG
jgi:hypothetical protein